MQEVGVVIQQGGFDLILQLYDSLQGLVSVQNPVVEAALTNLAQSLAKLFMKVNPKLISSHIIHNSLSILLPLLS